MKYYIFLLLFFVTACNKTTDDITSDARYIQKTIQYQNIENVKSNLSSFDINYFEKWTELKPVVVFVHGGGWSIGDKTNKPNSKIELFEDLKYVYVSINYRLSPYPFDKNNQNRIIHPTHVKDVAKAIKYIYDNIENYGGEKTKMAIMGHSAGAHLASLIATDSKYLKKEGLETSIFKGVVSLDTEAFDIFYIMQNTTKNSFQYNMFINAFGNNPEGWKDASPINYIFSTKANNWLVVYRGEESRISNQRAFINALQVNGKNVTSIHAGNYSHAGVNDAIGDNSDEVINKPVVDFLKEILK